MINNFLDDLLKFIDIIDSNIKGKCLINNIDMKEYKYM